MPGWVLPVATPPNTVITLPPVSYPPPGAMNPMEVTVAANTPKTVIDLGPIVGALGGLQQAAGLHLSVLGNTNSGLVQAGLSASKLVLNYGPGKFGEATVTVCATFPDGVSVQGQVLVTVLPPKIAAANGAVPVAAMTTGTPGTMLR
jgi:hypothetical protein